MRTLAQPKRFYLAFVFLVFLPVLLCVLHGTEQADADRPEFFGFDFLKESGEDPVLSAAGLNATFGYANITSFNFSITYQSSSNATPAYVNLTVVHENWTASHAMSKVHPAASNYVAGVRYQAIITLPTIGNYSHYFTASNGTGTARYPAVEIIVGPSVVWLRNYTMSVVPFKWLDSSTAIEPINNGYLTYNYSLQFPFLMYGRRFNQVQVSYFGYLRFNLCAINNTSKLPINVTGSDILSKYAIIGWSGIVWNQMPGGASNFKVLSTADYFLVEQQIWLNHSLPNLYNASIQYVLYKNGTILLSYDYAKINFVVTETVGVNFGDGSYYTPYMYSANLAKITLKFDYPFIRASRIANYSCTPEYGTHLTEFTFTIIFQNLENRAPLGITLTLGSTNYTMIPVDSIDSDYVNGRVYSRMIQFLSPNNSYHHSFHVLTPDGWWHSPVIDKPSTADLPIYNYSTCKLHYFDNPSLSNPITALSLFQTIDLPFNFTFYGVNFSRLVLCRYGFIRFSTNTSESQPIPGYTAQYSRISISFGNNNVQDGGTAVNCQLYSDKAIFVFPSMKYVYFGTYNLGTYKIIIYKNGDVVFSFSDLQFSLPGGINMGEGVHYTSINFTQTSFPLTSTSFIFSPPRSNVPGVNAIVNNELFKTSESITFQGTYNSSGNTPVVQASIKIEGKSYKGITYPANFNQMTFNPSGFTDYRADTKFVFSRTLPSGIYNATVIFVDIYGNKFNTVKVHFEVNDPPICNPVSTITYGGVGKTLTICVSYLDPEGFDPESFTIRWDTEDHEMNPLTSDFNTEVFYTWSVVLIHGIHTYSIYVKDKFRPETINVTVNKHVDVKWLPVIDIITLPPAYLLIPGDVEVKVRITSPEPGFNLVSNYVIVNGLEQFQLELVSGEPDTYTARIPVEWGEYHFSIVVSDGYNQVVYPAEGVISISVINLPLILGISIGGAAAVSILLFIQSRKRKAKAEQYARLRRQVLAKKPTRRDIEESAEEKRRARQEEAKNIEGIDVVRLEPAPVKKSAAVKRAATGSASKATPAAPPPRTPKAAASSGTQPKDKSGYSQKATDTGTLVNRTVLKEYIERQRKEGVRELHYLKIKNDLNIISQKKSSKLYRILQDLVDDEILVRKGSNYVIVG